MREIKFRVWDKKNNVYYSKIWGLSWRIGGIRFFWDDYKNSDGETMVTDLVDGDYELMQFTGLEDKNGIEIYEGDIYTYSVFVGPENGKYDCGYGSMVVEYRESICTETGNFLGIGFTIFSEHRGGIEVIGNIYENPELLTEVTQ
jgi:uncharacterized phage protein (TIGR01671 family)